MPRCLPPVRFARVLFAALFVASPSTARASNPLNPTEKPDPTVPPPPPGGHDDFTMVPAAGGTTDIGVGGGFFAGLARNKRGVDPYLWNIETAGFMTFLPKDGGISIPYTDVYAKLTVVHFLRAPLQLEVRPSFTDELALYYYGVGNASSAAVPAGKTTDFFEYGRLHPELLADLRFKIVGHFAGRVGVRYVRTWFDIPPGSKLADDIQSGPAEVKHLIGPTGTTGAALFRYGVQFDNRDNPVSSHSGTFDELAVNLSPGGMPDLPFRYGEVSANLRAFVPFGKRVVLALRVVGDVLFGDVPFYELSRAVDTYAVGGSNGVRGVPAQRYYGKVKAFGNVEVRGKLFDFHLFGKPFGLGSAAFFDGGRVWADTTPHPELDGTGFGLKYGVGAGLRLTSGAAFVLRADVAWSPDATPISGYVVAGECF